MSVSLKRNRGFMLEGEGPIPVEDGCPDLAGHTPNVEPASARRNFGMGTKRTLWASTAVIAGIAAAAIAVGGFWYGFPQHQPDTPIWFDFDVVYVEGRPGFELRMHREDWARIAAAAGPVRDPLKNEVVSKRLAQLVGYGIEARRLPCPENFLIYNAVNVGNNVAFDGLCASAKELKSLSKQLDGGYNII